MSKFAEAAIYQQQEHTHMEGKQPSYSINYL